MNNPALKLGLFYGGTFLLFFAFTFTQWSQLSRTDSFFCLGVAGFISLLGMLILFLKNNGDPQGNTFRLLIMITVQLLSYLSTSLALIYTNQSNVLVLHLLGLALSLILVQTIVLVKLLKSA